MLTARNLIETVISLRLYVWSKDDGTFMLYESLPEEGEGVKKRLGKLESLEKLNEFREEYEKELKAHLESIIAVKVKSLARKKAKDHPSAKSIKAKLKCDSVPLTLKPVDSIPTSTESSSSEQSTPISPEILSPKNSKVGLFPTTSPGTPTA